MRKSKTGKIIGFAIALLLVCGIFSIPLVNNYSAVKVSKELRELPLPEGTELIESVSKAGKLVGNGNGMQFLGAMLIKSTLSIKELDNYYADYRKNDWDCIVEKQEGKTIDVIEHGTLEFSEEIQGSGYYIVYSWGSGIKLFEELDIRGH